MQATGNSEAPVVRVGTTSVELLIPAAGNNGEAPVNIRREANAESELAALIDEMLTPYDAKLSECTDTVSILLDTDTLLVPADEYRADEAETLYRYTFSEADAPMAQPFYLDDVGSYVMFTCRKDVADAVGRHILKPVFMPSIVPVWRDTMKKDSQEAREMMYAYSKDGYLNIFAFQGRRFKFANRFKAAHPHDILYYILFVWEQLGMRPEKDGLRLMGSITADEWLKDRLGQFILHVDTDTENN